MQAVIIALTFILQGCASNDNEEMATDLTSQLFQAVEKGELVALQNALDQKVNINAQDSKKRTALMIATYNQDVEAVKLLIDAGAEGYLDILKLTIQAGADPTIVNRYGGTALIPAAEHGHVEVIEELLNDTTINVNHVNLLGWTALMEAIVLNNGNPIQRTVVQLLIDHGADVNIPDNDNVTPLQHAKKQGFKEIENILIEAGAE